MASSISSSSSPKCPSPSTEINVASSGSSSPKCPSPCEINVVSPSSSSSSPKYPSPSTTINVANFVSTKLFKDNYPLWKSQMDCLIVCQDLVGFIDGSISQPEEYLADQDYLIWRKTDHLLKGWILGSLSEEVLSSVNDLKTARDVWEYLKNKLGQREHTPVDRKQPSLTESEKSVIRKYLPLYDAVVQENWAYAELFINQDKDALSAKITKSSETVLHIAVWMGPKALNFVKKLVKKMPEDALSFRDREGDSALSVAAINNNMEAAKLLVTKKADLLYIEDNDGRLPVHLAARYANRATSWYLLKEMVISGGEDKIFEDKYYPKLIVDTIEAGFLEIAHVLVAIRKPDLAILVRDNSLLTAIAQKASVFPIGTFLNFWQSLIYQCVPGELDYYFRNPRGAHKSLLSFQTNCFSSVCKTLYKWLWGFAGLLVPQIKYILEKNQLHYHAIALVATMCNEILDSEFKQSEKDDILKTALFEAASRGIQEVVELIVVRHPDAIWFTDENNYTIFQLAIMHRHENIFKLIYQLSGQQRYITSLKDIDGNNILHLAAKLAPRHRLELFPGPLLQMKLDFQWFKEVERLVNSTQKNEQNCYEQTPSMVFSNEHKELVVEGEKWLKDMARSATSILISATIFAATFNIPGGYDGDDHHFSNSSKRFTFFVFVISESISLFASTTSLLVFLSILTARFAECDFLFDLPSRLILGLSSLFLSITCMMISFCATLYLVFGQNRTWVIVPMIALACLPVTFFLYLQFPILVYLVSSTYGRGIFGKLSILTSANYRKNRESKDGSTAARGGARNLCWPWLV